MLNTDYKIGAKALASRVKRVIGMLIGDNQSGFIANRFIGENIRFVLDLLDYTKANAIPGFLHLIDFEKAFDSLHWDFIDHTLRYLINKLK